ncbi:MAG: branched-chain amino acid transaminase [Candidatus Marsarchaeota archaeon]|jgi:branched-chain amino acid aminotransferase|nr:branched-chain amino acid transaminase [Candidatus Marsarchaeota archaeon]MCL5418403.1 branched-chain amino acid transaminase [Candidatus Marsarchaeota archaeon]
MESKYAGLKVWLDGRIVPYEKAVVPILTHSLQYGSGIFEGIRAYDTGKGTVIFRLKDHVKRFMNSMKIYYMHIDYSEEDIMNAILKVVKANKLSSCYIRPFAFYNSDAIGVSPKGKKISTYIAAVPFGAYFGAGKEKGIRCKVSSWHRINSLILPPQAKASGNYINSILASMEAAASGMDEAILTAINGYVAEGPGENIFVVENNKLITPSRESDILLGITRDTVIMAAEGLGIEVVERSIHKEELYTADELFFAGTAAEITPIVSVDSIQVGSGKPGPITKIIAEKYSSIVTGKDKEYSDWLTYV